jgi:uncharacterized protein with beta-barrel porin domain
MGGVGLTPYAAAQVIAFDLPAYGESAAPGANAFALSYGAKTVTATRGELGLRSDKSFAVNDAILTLRGRAAWRTTSIRIAPSPRPSRPCPAQASSLTAQRKRTTARWSPPPPK